MRFVHALAAVAAVAAAAPAQEKTFDSNGVKIAYFDEGTGDAVVLIHGFTASASEMWVRMPFAATQILPDLAKDFRVIAPDMRGHGKSDKPHDPKKYGREMADDIVRLLDHLKVKRAHVVGYSMGAMVAGKLVAAYPDRVRSVTFGGGGPVFQSPKEFTSVLDATGDALAKGKGIGPLMIALTPEGQTPPTADEAAAASLLFLAGKDQKALAAVARGLSGLEVTEAELKAVRVPVRFVYGDRDPLKELAVRAGKIVPKSDAVVVPKGDHISVLLAPEYRKAVRDFVAANKE